MSCVTGESGALTVTQKRTKKLNNSQKRYVKKSHHKRVTLFFRLHTDEKTVSIQVRERERRGEELKRRREDRRVEKKRRDGRREQQWRGETETEADY